MNSKDFQRAYYVTTLTQSYGNFTPTINNSIILVNASGHISAEELNLKLSKPEFRKDDVIYISPGCTIPRFKLGPWCSERGVKLTAKVNDATVIFASEKTMGEIMGNRAFAICDKQVYIQYVKTKFSAELAKIEAEKIEEEKCDLVVVSHIVYHQMIRDNPSYSSGLKMKNHTYLKNDRAASFFDYVTAGDRIFYHESVLVKEINCANVMDQEGYESISKMLASPDPESQNLAIELISNSDLEGSAPYLVFLLYKNSKKIAAMSAYKKVNCRAMLNYFGVEDLFRADYASMKKWLAKNNLNTIENSRIITELMAQDLQAPS